MAEKHSFERLAETMARLRGPDGCLWDKEQTHQSLKPYLIEETYEVIDAIDKGDMIHLKEELGDLLLQVVFHAQMAAEKSKFTIDDILEEIVDKLERRHPHIFAGVEVKTSREIVERWERIKRAEKEEEESRLARIPRSLPALLYAFKIQQKMAEIGFDWRKKEDVVMKFKEELKELDRALKGEDNLKEEIGDILFMIVNLSRHYDIEPESTLREAVKKFEKRFEYMEAKAREAGKPLEEMSLEEQDRLWEKAKETED
jgi:tetrapyrrole methylase family protein/MazG family protein